MDENQNGLYDREFDEVIVTGDLSWANNKEEIQGISHFFENAVTIDTDQVITGKVTFLDGFEAKELEAEPWINDVDIDKIQEDAIRPGGDPIVNFSIEIYHCKV